MTTGMDEIAGLVRKALAAEDLSAFAELLDPEVTWGAPGARNPTYKSRNQVWPGISGVEMLASRGASMTLRSSVIGFSSA